METTLGSASNPVVIAPDALTVMIGERINPTGRKVFSAELQAGDLSRIARDARAQVAAGAGVVDVNVGAVGVDEVRTLPEAIRIVQDTVDAPICIDTANPEALAAALKVVTGKALVNSVNGEEKRLRDVLPLVAEHGAAVIGLCMDDNGIPATAEERVAVAERILARAAAFGIPAQDVVLDPLVLTIGADQTAMVVTTTTARLIREHLGNNLTAGASNASHGMPDRELLNVIFMAGLIGAGVNAPICNPEKVGLAVRAADLMLGRDEWGSAYIQTFRQRERAQKEAHAAANA